MKPRGGNGPHPVDVHVGGRDDPGVRYPPHTGTGASSRTAGSSPDPITFKQLRYHLAVVKARGVTGASGILHVAQPAIGQQIRALEAELGVKLFVRHCRGMEPTEAGELLARHAEEIVAEAERMRQDIMDMGRAPRGRIALGLTGTAARMFGARLIRVCRGEYPDLELTVTEATGHRLAAWLGQGELDMAVTCGPVGTGAVSEALAVEALYFVAPPGHALAEGPDIALRAVLNADLVLPPKPAVIHGQLAKAVGAIGGELRVACTVESVAAISDLVQCGAGCAVMAYGAIRREVEDGRLAALPIVDPHLARTLYLACVQDRTGSGAVEAVCREIRTLASELLASDAAGWTPCAKPSSD